MKVFNKNLYHGNPILFFIFYLLLQVPLYSIGYKEKVSHEKTPLKSSEVWSGTFKEYNQVFYLPMPDEKPGPLRKREEKLPYSGLIEVMDSETGIYQKKNFKDGIAEGEAQNFYEVGRLYEKGNFKNGEKEGKWTTYRFNGNILITEYYKNGKRHGKLTSFDEEGRLSEMISFRKGKRHGKCIQYREGNPAYKSYYSFGKLIKRSKIR